MPSVRCARSVLNPSGIAVDKEQRRVVACDILLSAVGNTVLLAAVCASGILPFGLSVFEEALRKFLPAKILDVNLRALEIGESILAGK